MGTASATRYRITGCGFRRPPMLIRFMRWWCDGVVPVYREQRASFGRSSAFDATCACEVGARTVRFMMEPIKVIP